MAGKKKTKEPNIEIDQRQPHPQRKPKVTEYAVNLHEDMEEVPEDVIAIKQYPHDAKYTVELRDPHNHAFIIGPKLPIEMQGAYTSYGVAKRALDLWLEQQKGK